MKKYVFVVTMLLITTFILQAQESDQRVIDEKSGREILIGNVTRQGFENLGEWFDAGYRQYTPDSAAMDSIRKYEANFPDVFIVLGTWCGDSREQLSHFFKILDQINYPSEKINMIAVDRDKKSGDYSAANDDIQFVPTFIFSLHAKEIGRIIETPMHSLEHDFLNILKNSASVSQD